MYSDQLNPPEEVLKRKEFECGCRVKEMEWEQFDVTKAGFLPRVDDWREGGKKKGVAEYRVAWDF